MTSPFPKGARGWSVNGVAVEGSEEIDDGLEDFGRRNQNLMNLWTSPLLPK